MRTIWITNPPWLNLPPHQTLKQNTPESQSMLESRLPALCAAVCPQCSHVETNVRKQSIFCLVELLLIFGTERVDTMLDSLTVSQVGYAAFLAEQYGIIAFVTVSIALIE